MFTLSFDLVSKDSIQTPIQAQRFLYFSSSSSYEKKSIPSPTLTTECEIPIPRRAPLWGRKDLHRGGWETNSEDAGGEKIWSKEKKSAKILRAVRGCFLCLNPLWAHVIKRTSEHSSLSVRLCKR